MARPTGLITFTGSIGDLNAYKSKDGDIIRKKPRVETERLLFSDQFANSRKASAVFGLASVASRLIRTAFHEMIPPISNRNMHNRLLAALQKNAEGTQSLHRLPFHQLNNFDISEKALFTSVFGHQISIDMPSPGKITVTIPPFYPKMAVSAPKNAKLLHICAGAAVIDCDKKTFRNNIQKTAGIPLKSGLTEEIQLHLSIKPQKGNPLLIALALRLFLVVNDKLYLSEDKEYLPFLIAAVVHTPPPVTVTPAKKRPNAKKPGTKKKAAKKRSTNARG